MKFFTPQVLKNADSFESARSSYWQHISDIRAEMPGALFNLHNHYSLHDAEIASFTRVDDSDLFVILDGCRNGALADTDRVAFVLHFFDSLYSKRTLNSFLHEDILYVEIGRGEKHQWAFSALTTRESRNDVLTIEFNDFGYYLHDYRKGPE